MRNKTIKNHFLSFPLSLLSLDRKPSIIANLIIDYSIIEMTIKLNTHNINDYINYESGSKPKDYNPEKSKWHRGFIKAIRLLNINCPSIKSITSGYDTANEHISEMYKLTGKRSPNIWLNNSIVFETRNGQFNSNWFRVLCAVNSVVGNKKFCRITKETIRYRMLGYANKAAYSKAGKNEPLMTDRQIGRILEHLNERKLFGRFTYAKRITYYSVKTRDNAKLSELIKADRIYKAKLKYSGYDKVATEKIKAAIQSIKRGESPDIELSAISITPAGIIGVN